MCHRSHTDCHTASLPTVQKSAQSPLSHRRGYISGIDTVRQLVAQCIASCRLLCVQRHTFGKKLTLTAADWLVMTGQGHRSSPKRHLVLLLSPALSNMRSGRTRRHFRIVRKIAKTDINFVMSVCPSAWNNRTANGRIIMKFDIRKVYENLPRNSRFITICQQ